MAEIQPLTGSRPTNPAHFQEPADVGGAPTLSEDVKKRRAAISALALEGKLPDRGDDRTHEVRAEAEQRRNALVQQQADGVIQSPTGFDTKREALRRLAQESARPMTLEEGFVRQVATNSQSTALEGKNQEAIIEHAKEIAEGHRALELAMRGSGMTIPPDQSMGEILDDFAELILLPGTYGIPIVQAIEKTFPGMTTGMDMAFPGRVTRIYKDRLSQMDPQARADAILRTQAAINDLRLLGVIENDMMEFDVAQALFDDIEDGVSDELLNDFIGLLDITLFAEAARFAVSGSRALIKRVNKFFRGDAQDLSKHAANMRERKGATTSVSATLDEADPDLSRQVTEAALEDPTEATAQSVGSSKAQMTAESLLPKGLVPLDEGERLIANSVRPGPDLVDDPGFGSIIFTPDELDQMQKGVQQAFQDAKRRSMGSGVPLVSKYTYDTSVNGYKAQAVVGATANHGFTSLKQAQAAMKGFREVIPEGEVEYLARKWNSGEYVPVDELDRASGGNEYLARFTLDEPFNSRWATAQNPVRDKTEAFSGRKARFLDKDSWALPWMAKAGNQAADQAAFRLNRLRTSLKPFSDLGPEDTRKVLQQVAFGDEEGVWLSRGDLIREWAHEPARRKRKLIEGYEAVRRHQGLVYDYMNDAVYRRLRSRDVSEIVLNGVRHLGHKIEALPRDVTRVYDPDLKKVRDISFEEAQALKDKGNAFASLSNPIRSGNEIIDFSILPKSGKNSKVNPLPYNVLSNNDGYISRFYDAAYLVRQNYKARVNGATEPTTKHRVVGIESSLRNADELLEQLNADAIAKGEDLDFEIVRSSELDTENRYYDVFNLEYLRDTGQLYTGHRGDEILGKFDTKLDKRRKVIRTLADSLEISQAAAARAGTLDLTVDKLSQNWNKMFAERYGVERFDAEGKLIGKDMPWFGEVPKGRNFKPELQRDWADAVAFRDHIKMLAGLDESRLSFLLEEAIINSTEALMGSRAGLIAGDGLLRLRNVGVIDQLKGLAFFQLITMKPARQLLLQANQMTMYLGRDDAARYFLTDKGTAEFLSLGMGMLVRSADQLDGPTGKALAKSFGMSHKEYKDFIETYIKTGLPDAIDSHLWAAITQVDPNIAKDVFSAAGRTKERLRSTRRALGKWARRVGFDLGEQTQLITAFLTEKHAWQVANPKKAHLWNDPKNLADIAAEARRLSLNMNRAGALGFQKGIMSAAFQFMSHATKSMQMVLPQTVLGVRVPGVSNLLTKLGSKKLREAEKYKLATAQLLIYGTGGLGMSEAYESIKENLGFDVPSDADLIVEEGIFGTAFNMAMRIAEGEDYEDLLQFTDVRGNPINRDTDVVDVEASKVLSPLGGSQFWHYSNPATRMYEFLALTNSSIWDLAGPGVEVAKRMFKGFDSVGHIVGDATYLNTPDRIEASLIELASSTFLTADDFQKMRFERAVGRYLSQRGNVGTTAENTEILTRFLFGPKARAENRIQQLRIDQQGLRGDLEREPELGNRIKNDAKDSFDHIKRVMVLAEKGEITGREMNSLLRKQAEWYHHQYGADAREQAVYKGELMRRLLDWTKQTKLGPEYQVTTKLAAIFPRASNDEREEMLNRLREMPAWEGQEQLVRQMDAFMR